jgi:hypothetical protein
MAPVVTFGDGRGECGFAMVDVPDGADVDVWLVAHEGFLAGCHSTRALRRAEGPELERTLKCKHSKVDISEIYNVRDTATLN